MECSITNVKGGGIMLRILKVGDQVVVNKSWSTEQRVGTVSEISIQTLADDHAGEAGRQVNVVSLDLDYGGSISYTTENGEDYWCYLAQIDREASSRLQLEKYQNA